MRFIGSVIEKLQRVIHVIAAIMLPVLLAWSLGVASLGFGLGKPLGHGVRAVLVRLAKR